MDAVNQCQTVSIRNGDKSESGDRSLEHAFVSSRRSPPTKRFVSSRNGSLAPSRLLRSIDDRPNAGRVRSFGLLGTKKSISPERMKHRSIFFDFSTDFIRVITFVFCWRRSKRTPVEEFVDRFVRIFKRMTR